MWSERKLKKRKHEMRRPGRENFEKKILREKRT